MSEASLSNEKPDQNRKTSASEASCFHCGLPVPPDLEAPLLTVWDTERQFCCHGCQAVCHAILDAGLDEYYRHRSESATTANQQDLPGFIRHLELYDRPDIQKDFVFTSGDWCEAALLLENIRCPACLWLNERHLRSLPGVLDVHIDDITHRARVRWNPEQTRLSTLLKAITDIGYIAHPYDPDRHHQLQEERNRRSMQRLIFAGATGMLVMNFSLATYFMGQSVNNGALPLWIVIGRWSSLLISLAILAYPGQEFFISAWRDIKKCRPGMDIPIVLGLSAALLGSLHATVTQTGEVYYDSIAMFVFFLLLARRWEMQGKLKALDHMDRLARAVPRTARRLDKNGHVSEVFSGELQPGDLLQIVPGETLPVDGIITRGTSSFDESLLTGEPLPVLHSPGDQVVAGSINGEQPIIIRVKQSVQASAVSEIQQLVDHGISLQPQYAVLSELVARWFVIVVLLIATATALYWLQAQPSAWLHNTIAVLIITCPCALALATPVALAVTAGRLLEKGIVPMNMRALDSLVSCDMAVFDKTGTLTRGQAVITDVIPLANLPEKTVLRVATALSKASEHPLAKAFRAQPDEQLLEVTQMTNVPGEGILGIIAGEEWRLGKESFCRSPHDLKREVQHRIDQLTRQGKVITLLANSQGIQAVFGFNDPLRDGIDTLLKELKSDGIDKFAILSGDNQTNVSAIANALGIESAYGNLSPADKLRWIRDRQQEGHRLIMLGDGINDAPTLAAADVSLSFSEATDLANVNSDFLILGNKLSALADTHKLAKRTRNNIAQNLIWALSYNLLAVPLAAAGWIPPWGAALGMSFSSLFVVLNALRLQRY